MTVTIRAPEEAAGRPLGDVMQVSLNLDPAGRSAVPPLPLKDFRVAFGRRPGERAAEFRFLQWFAGRSMPMSGIFGVATLPEYRGGGVMRDVVSTLMREAHGRAPPSPRCTRRCWVRTVARLRDRRHVQRTPARDRRDPRRHRRRVRGPRVHPEDLPAVRACWSAAMRDATGTIEPDGDGGGCIERSTRRWIRRSARSWFRPPTATGSRRSRRSSTRRRRAARSTSFGLGASRWRR